MDKYDTGTLDPCPTNVTLTNSKDQKEHFIASSHTSINGAVDDMATIMSPFATTHMM